VASSTRGGSRAQNGRPVTVTAKNGLPLQGRFRLTPQMGVGAGVRSRSTTSRTLQLAIEGLNLESAWLSVACSWNDRLDLEWKTSVG